MQKNREKREKKGKSHGSRAQILGDIDVISFFSNAGRKANWVV